MNALDDATLRQLFLDARTHMHWQDKPVTDEQLRRLYELAHFGPTSANLNPLRVVFVKSAAAKERLKPALFPNNVEKTMTAPVTAIVAYDLEFYEQAATLFPIRDMRTPMLAMPAERREKFALVSGTLGGAYLLLAARALGLDCGPLGGFDNAKVDEAFFAGTGWRSNFLMNLGYGDPTKLHPRLPRLSFEQAARIE